MNLDELKFDEKGLITTVVQDYKDKEVLMVAFMNKESLEKTLETGKATYFSRSRQSLWVKGETSGHFQNVKEISYDCDQDALLLKIEQVGDSACHTGARSCFYRNLKTFEKIEYKESVLTDLFNLIKDRKENPISGSYTTYLFEKGIDKILKKVGEESAEVIIGAKNNDGELVYEACDLIYHLLVLLVDQDVKWDTLIDELVSRRNKQHEKNYETEKK